MGMPKVKTRSVKDGAGRKMVQVQHKCGHAGCSNLVWVTIGMPGHPCCDGCFKNVCEVLLVMST